MTSPLLALSGPQVVEVCVLPLTAAVILGFLLGLPTRWLGPGLFRAVVRVVSVVPPSLAAAGFLGIVAFNVWADGFGSLKGNAPEFLVLLLGAASAAWAARRLWTASAALPVSTSPKSVPTSASNTGIP